MGYEKLALGLRSALINGVWTVEAPSVEVLLTRPLSGRFPSTVENVQGIRSWYSSIVGSLFKLGRSFAYQGRGEREKRAAGR